MLCPTKLHINTITIIEKLIPKQDSVRLLNKIMEELNYEKLMNIYSPKGRKPVVQPKTLFKILVYAYMNNIYSTRKIELYCRKDINFIWLLSDQKVPDHNTIERFRSKRIISVIDDLFYSFIEKLIDLGEIERKIYL